MKKLAWLLSLACAMASPMSAAMMIAADARQNSVENDAKSSASSGTVDSISTLTRKIVINGKSYMYSPTGTVITVNRRRAVMSDIHPGDRVWFRQAVERDGRTPGLTSITVRGR